MTLLDNIDATLGACLGNPGPGSWGVILRWRGHEQELSGGEPMTTNNRMEMTAAIEALEASYQRCYVRFLRNALDYVPRKVDGLRAA